MDSYINLLNDGVDDATWEDSQDFSPIGEQPPPIEEATAAMRPNNKRSRNFTENEDNVLVSAWLNTSIDAATGNEQTRDSYWARIHRYYHDNKYFDSTRNQNSISNRWGTIQAEVNKFCGYYERIQNRRQSGITEADKIVQARTLYKTEDKAAKPFGLLHCWNVLRHHPKWTDRLSQKKQKTTSNASLATSSPGTTSSRYEDVPEKITPKDDPLRRPIGKKSEKERRGKSSSSQSSSSFLSAFDSVWSEKRDMEAVREAKKEARYERAFVLEQERLALEKEMLEFQIAERDERIMSMNTSEMTGSQQQYYLGLQGEITARRYNRSG